MLVGAGPGDISLLTCKGFEALQKADCILYDHLVDPVMLGYAKAECECIYVGKKASQHTLAQDKINTLLVEKANIYETVVRLKGGDGYVFGRGGEEALYLKKHGIAFEFVPGISSCMAGLAYAGIPITHRGVSTGFHVFTAHHKQNELADINWTTMLQDDQTYVFLMGLSKVEEIAQQLMNIGKPWDTPIAVISNATLPSQDVVVSDILHITHDLALHPVASPAIIVVGNVVNLRKDLNFFEEKKLFHARIMIPKVGKKTTTLTTHLKALGAFVQEVQVSDLIPHLHVLEKIDLKKYTYVMFTSKHAITYFMEAMRSYEIDIRSLSHMHIAVIGKATQAYLQQYGLYADIVPSYANSEALYQCLCDHLQEEDKILFPRVSQPNEMIQKLKEHWEVEELSIYENRECDAIHFCEEEFNHYDMVVCNCSSAVHHLMRLVSSPQVLNDLQIISIGETTSHTLRSYGIHHYQQAKSASYEAVEEKIIQVWEEQHVSR